MASTSKKPYSPEVISRALQMVAERAGDEPEWQAIQRVAAELGIRYGNTVLRWVRQAENDAGRKLTPDNPSPGRVYFLARQDRPVDDKTAPPLAVKGSEVGLFCRVGVLAGGAAAGGCFGVDGGGVAVAAAGGYRGGE